MTEPTEHQCRDMARQLREDSKGRKVWRVQDPETKAYCLQFDRSETGDPEGDAREWLRHHREQFPGSQYAGFEVAEVVVLSDKDRLMQRAADLLSRVRVAPSIAALF